MSRSACVMICNQPFVHSSVESYGIAFITAIIQREGKATLRTDKKQWYY